MPAKIEERETPSHELLTQHWEHARHLSKLSLNFTSIYFVIMGGAFALSGTNPMRSLMVIFLVLLSLAGVPIQIKHGVEYYHHVRYMNAIARSLEIEDWVGSPLEMHTNPKLIETSQLYSPQHWLLLIHITGFAGSMWLLVEILEGSPVLALTVFLVAFVAPVVYIVPTVVLKFKEIDEQIRDQTGVDINVIKI